MDITDLRALLQRLRKNLATLQDREAKYGGDAPLSLLNQLDDYKQAIDLTKEALIGDISPEELAEALKPLILDIDSPIPPQPQIEIPPPPEPVRLPLLEEFAARRSELMYFASKLASNHLAVLTGMPGMGKTTLAIMLADFWKLRMSVQTGELGQVGQEFTLSSRFSKTINKIFWYTFRPQERLESVIWQLAAFLAWNGQEDLWKMLQSARQVGGQPPPPSVLFDYLFQMLQGWNYLLCLDEFQFVSDDPLLEQFVERLVGAISARDLYLIIVSDRLPDFAQQMDFAPLGGFQYKDTRDLVALRGLSLPDELVAEMHNQTGGNPQFLVLAIDALRRARDPADLVANLVETDDIERFLLKEVDNGLTGQERDVMSVVAVLLDYPGSRGVIEAILDRGNLRRILRDLSDRYLLTVSTERGEREYGQNALVRAFYYDSLSPRHKRQMHCRAAEYYEQDEPEPLRAALHYEQAGEYTRAVALLTTETQTLINQGQARPLRYLLERFTVDQLDQKQWAAVNIAMGRIDALLGEDESARKRYQEALSTLTLLPSNRETDDLKANLYRWWAELHYQSGEYTSALERVEEGLAVLAGRETPETAGLVLIAAQTRIRQGDYRSAQEQGEQSLQLAQRLGQISVLGRVNNLLGRLANQQGANTLAVTYFEKALALYRRLGDVVGEARTQNLIGTVQFEMGKWPAAEMSFRQASEHFLRLGDVYYLAGVNNNMGIIALNQGRLDEALEIYQQGLDLLKQRREGALYLRALFEASLGATFIRRGEGETARKHLQRAQDYCQQIEARDFFPELHRLWAEAALLAGDLGEAVVQAKKSLELARELGMRGDEGRTLRVLGQIIAAQGQLDLAVDQLGQSIAILAEVGDEYEQARSRLALAGAYLAQGNVEAGEAALAQCRPVFERLGSELDLAAAQTLQKKLVRKG